MNPQNQYGYTISYEPVSDKKTTRKVVDLMHKMHKVAGLGAKDGKKRIEKAIAEYPDIPQFKNYLSVWYAKRGEIDKTFEYNRQIIEQHPDYLFAKVNLAHEYLQNDQFDKVTELLGKGIEIKQIYPDRDEFHITEVTAVLGIAIQYYIKTDNLEQAKIRLDILREIDPDSDLIDRFQMEIIGVMFEKSPLFNRREIPRTSIIQPCTTTTEPPVFHHKQMHWLYQQATLTDEQVTELLALPRQTLIADLEAVLKDSIERYSYFEEHATHYRELSFVLHALLWLKELKAEESLPVVWEVLAQSEEYLELYLDFILTENVWEILFVLGENQLDKLLVFAKQPNVYTYSKTQLTQALSQIALHHPERRTEVESWFKDVFGYYADVNPEKVLIDDTFIGLAICDVVDFCGVEVKEEIKTLFEKERVDQTTCGNWDDVVLDFQNNTKQDKHKFTSLRKLYDMISDDKTQEDDYYDDYEDVDDNKFLNATTPYVKPKEPGRNDPCFCGSGKKYKKCCM